MESNIHVTGLVILAALSHATWNAIVKNNEDSLSAMAMVMGTGAVAGAVAIPFMPALPREIWGYLVLSVVLHLAYQLLLVRAYRLADLSQVFPIFRGIPPILVALLSGIIAGESLASAQVAGIFVISVGIGSLAFHRGWPQGRDRIALTYAGGTAVAITSYTFADGLGVRLSGDSLAYAAWLFLFNGLPYVLIAWAVRGNGLWPLVRRNWKTGLGSGVVAIGGFSIVLWAFAHAPLAAVSAVRETSVIFAAVIGAVFLREPFGRMRILAAILVAAGVALLQVGI